MVGNAQSGKTSLLSVLTKSKPYPALYTPTLGCELFTRNIVIPGTSDETQVELSLFDCSGLPLYTEMIQQLCAGSLYACICFSYQSLASFQSIQSWIKHITPHLISSQQDTTTMRSAAGTTNQQPQLYGCIIGCKSDAKAQSDITQTMLDDLVGSQQNFALFDTSAQLNENFDVPFNFLAQQCYERHLKEKSGD
jgi:GTPase SAR1 family protein